MATFINMPKLSDTMEEGTILKWHVKEGATISVGDVVADVETDKATMEMEAFDEGILGKIYISDGAKQVVGGALAVLIEKGEEIPEAPAPPVAAAAPADSSPSPSPSASPAAAAPSAAPAATIQVQRTASGRIKASPLARKVAAAKGIDLSTVAGSGPGGRIIKRDVENAPAGGSTVAAGAAPAAPKIRPSMDFDPQAERLPLSGMRKIIADRLSISKSTIPHFYLNVDLEASRMMKLRKQVNESAQDTGNKFTVNDFILKATVMAAVDVPEVNSAWDYESIVQYKSINLAVAIAVPDGLVTPVIKDAQDKTMLEISRAVKDLAERAKNKKLSPDEFAGGTITVSNLGSFGVETFDAIINPPQAAILSIGGIKNTPVVNDKGEIVAGQRLAVGMSCDHRVVDGAVGATYLQAFRKYIENPELMLV